MEDLKRMAIFATVVQQGSMSAAARLLDMSPSAVSQHIRNLEERLGKPLFRRLPRGLALTDEGQALWPTVAQSFERIHRSNLVMMGVLPLTFKPGENWQSLGLTGHETYDIPIDDSLKVGQVVTITATDKDGTKKTFEAKVRLDTETEYEYYRNGGILQTVLRNFLKG